MQDVYVILEVTDYDKDDSLCDCALGHSVARLLSHTLPQLEHKMTNDSVVILSHINIYLTHPSIFNVVKSGI